MLPISIKFLDTGGALYNVQVDVIYLLCGVGWIRPDDGLKLAKEFPNFPSRDSNLCLINQGL